MIRHLIILGLIFLTVLSCSRFKKSDAIATKPDSKSVIEQDISNMIYSNIITHEFSDPGSLDTFKISIQGKSLLDGVVYFDIINSSDEKIYSVEFKSYLLLNYDIDNSATDFEKETFIKTRIDKFFDSDNFLFPAINDGETFESDYSEKTIWDEISSDKKSIGFIYLIGEEDNKSIAYSKKQKKVVIYFNCC